MGSVRAAMPEVGDSAPPEAHRRSIDARKTAPRSKGRPEKSTMPGTARRGRASPQGSGSGEELPGFRGDPRLARAGGRLAEVHRGSCQNGSIEAIQQDLSRGGGRMAEQATQVELEAAAGSRITRQYGFHISADHHNKSSQRFDRAQQYRGSNRFSRHNRVSHQPDAGKAGCLDNAPQKKE